MKREIEIDNSVIDDLAMDTGNPGVEISILVLGVALIGALVGGYFLWKKRNTSI